MPLNTFAYWSKSSLLLGALLLGVLPQAVFAQNQSAGPNVQIVNPTPPPSSSIYTLEGGKRLMDEAAAAVNSQNYAVAARKLLEARTVMNQLSNFYQSLNSSFLGIDTVAADSNRRRALEAAQLRDQATFQLALVYRVNNQPELAVPLLVEIIRSQNPTRELGQKAYQQLLELGFVDVPFPRTGGVPSGTPAASPPPATSANPQPRQ
ncbi:MAG: hypothetical protein P3X23_006990 [Thermosynechococcus sp. Uc]|uniref:hypothetical protein n=1 Tax=Thermosynechococcus sp. Uc TaxID=3034853 RepID=UPI0019EC0569|nr:hypothetical protein [Thermosynechococcus sp. Uc]MDM7326840.1 hypothetical protein [Thermosynechococcus sp. Uc]HIK24462.1 hypothetical protein [Thermosynechococcus sp. M46_R2017_013]